MKICPNCYKNVSDEARFCENCGRKIDVLPTQNKTPPPLKINNPASPNILPLQSSKLEQKKRSNYFLVGCIFFFIASILFSSILHKKNISLRTTENTPQTTYAGNTSIQTKISTSNISVGTPTKTRTPTITLTPTQTLTPTISITPTKTYTPTFTATSTFTPTFTKTATFTSTPTKTPTRTKTPIPPISIFDVYQNHENMTGLQFSDYKYSIMGKNVSESVVISNVDNYGNVSLLGPWNEFSIFEWWDFCVVVTNVPKDDALQLSGGSHRYLTAKISRIMENYSFYINCETQLVLDFVKFGQ